MDEMDRDIKEGTRRTLVSLIDEAIAEQDTRRRQEIDAIRAAEKIDIEVWHHRTDGYYAVFADYKDLMWYGFMGRGATEDEATRRLLATIGMTHE